MEPVGTQEPAGTNEPAARPDPGETVVRALKSSRRSKFRAGLAVGAVVAVAIVLLIIQNGKSAHFTWLAFHFTPPLWIMLLLTAAAGAVVWEVIKAGSRRASRLRGERREALKAAREMTQGQPANGH